MPKIETLVDTFTDLSNWEDGLVTNGTITATGGLLTSNVDSANDSHFLFEKSVADDHTFSDTWMTIECVDYVQTGLILAYSGLLTVCDDFGNIIAGVLIAYVEGTDEVTFYDYTGATSVTISNPGTPIYLAVDFDSSNGYSGYYSLDSGSTWNLIVTDTYDTSFGLPHHALIGSLTVGPGPFTLTQDNFNVVAYPHVSGPIEIDVDPANITVAADPRVRVLLGPYLTVNLSGVEANVTATVTLDNPLLGIRIDLDAPINVTVSAQPYDSITFGDPYVTFTPANIQVTVNPPSIELSEEDPVILVGTAEVDVLVNSGEPIVGDFIQGDPFAYPWPISESGTAAYDMTDYTFELGETNPAGTSHTQWLKYYSPVPATLTLDVSSTDAFVLEVLEGTTISGLTSLLEYNTLLGGSLTTTLNVDISTGYTYIRLSSGLYEPTITLTWSAVAHSSPLFMDILTPTLAYTPDSVTVAVQGADPNESVRFYWSPPVTDLIPGTTTRPITLATIGSDFEGNILVGTIEIPAVYAGNYTFTAKGLISGKLATGSFTVSNNPLPDDTIASPTEPVASMTVKWLWDDGRGHTWVMPKNPERMGSVVFKKSLSADRASAGGGQHIVWQGATPALSWSFNGTITTEDEYDEIIYFYSLNRKFYITTHRNKTYVVTVRNVEMVPRRNGDNFWTYDYSVDCFLYEEHGGG